MPATERQSIIQGLLILFCISVVVTFNSLFDANGALSPDSTQYLAYAQRLLEGNSIWHGGEVGHFATWPIGYPFLIYLVAELSGLSVFMASKVVNLIFVAGSLGLIGRFSPGNTVYFSLLLCLGSYLQIFTYSWSEVPFIFALLWYGISLYKILADQSLTWHISLLCSAIALFMFRYVGAFSLLPIALIGLYKLSKQDYRGFFILTLVGGSACLLMVAYLYNNYQLTGWATGRERVPPYESTMQLLMMTIKGFMQETTLIIGRYAQLFWTSLVIQTCLLLLAYLYFRQSSSSPETGTKQPQTQGAEFSFVFLLVGISYYLAIISLRWSSHFDNLNTRLLAPGTLLVLIAALNFVFQHTSQYVQRIAKLTIGLLAAASLLIAMVLPVITHDSGRTSYYAALGQVITKYDTLSENTLVVFGSTHMRYINTRLVIKRPYAHPLSENKQSPDDYLSELANDYPDYKIVVDVAEGLGRCERLHPSWCEWLRRYKDEDFIALKTDD